MKTIDAILAVANDQTRNTRAILKMNPFDSVGDWIIQYDRWYDKSLWLYFRKRKLTIEEPVRPLGKKDVEYFEKLHADKWETESARDA